MTCRVTQPVHSTLHRRWWRRILLVCLWSGCCFGWGISAPLAQATEVWLSGDRILYRGLITEEANDVAARLLASRVPAPTVLLIESNGGNARAGIELGLWVFRQRLDVEVQTFCFSSCANYVFTAGARKRLWQHASLLWHGGPSQPLTVAAQEQLLDATLQALGLDARERLLAQRSPAELLEELQCSLRELVELETRFFTTIDVDQRITTLGQLHEPDGGPYQGWDYSLQDLGVLGVRAIELDASGVWQPDLPIAGARIFRLDLSALPDFTPRKFLSAPEVP